VGTVEKIIFHVTVFYLMLNINKTHEKLRIQSLVLQLSQPPPPRTHARTYFLLPAQWPWQCSDVMEAYWRHK